MRIRPATGDEAGALSALARRAKAQWGYSKQLLALWSQDLEISMEFIQQNHVFVAETSGNILGCVAMVIHQDMAELEHFWIEPARMRQGIGRALFEHVRRAAGSRGVTRFRVVSDPHAVPFYEKLGGVLAGEVDGLPAGRKLPVLEIPAGSFNGRKATSKEFRP